MRTCSFGENFLVFHIFDPVWVSSFQITEKVEKVINPCVDRFWSMVSVTKYFHIRLALICSPIESYRVWCMCFCGRSGPFKFWLCETLSRKYHLPHYGPTPRLSKRKYLCACQDSRRRYCMYLSLLPRLLALLFWQRFWDRSSVRLAFYWRITSDMELRITFWTLVYRRSLWVLSNTATWTPQATDLPTLLELRVRPSERQHL